MCKFFSFVGDGYGNYLYADWNLRKTRLRANWDSHTTILTHFKVPPKMQDRWSNYVYNPLTKEFTVDQGVEGHDHEAAENWVRHLNFKSVVKHLIIKKIRNPLTGSAKKATEKEIALLEEWIKVMDSVGASVEVSVGVSVWYSVYDSIWYSIVASVRASVWYSVRDLVIDSVGAYTSSFFKIKYEHDFSSAVKLWNAGFVPSFDGKKWRLHSGKTAEIVYERRRT